MELYFVFMFNTFFLFIFRQNSENMYVNYARWMQQHETLSSIHITFFHSNLISIIWLYQLSTLVKYQSTYYLYWQSYKVEHFCIETSIRGGFYIDYSNKNIPIPTKEEYKIQLISKVESILKRMHWKALHFLERLESSNKVTYRFK